MSEKNISPGLFLDRLKKYLPNIGMFLFVYSIVLAVLYFCVVLLPGKIFGYTLEGPAVLYILLSGSAIIMTTWGDEITLFITQSFAKFGVVAKQPGGILSEKKIRFLIILIYFVAIVVFTLASLTSHPIFDGGMIDYSVIQSFATYIAYDRLVRNYPTIL